MTEIGYFLATEEHRPNDLVAQACQAEEAGFRRLWISDHYHPWTENQGQASFVWCVIGALAARTRLPVTTAVTCPTIRIHPAIIAQAAATAAVMMEGRFSLGIGTGENLNEHVLGDRWPAAGTRLEMLEEAVAVMRKLWDGKLVRHEGRHYRVDDARLYTLPDTPPPVIMSAFGPKSVSLAARIADGYASTMPDADLLRRYTEEGGQGPKQGGMKVCWAEDEAAARKTVLELWPNEAVPGELAQELPMPAHFEQAAQLVTEEMMGEAVVCGPDPERHLEQIRTYLNAGFDEVYVNQIGPDQAGFFDFYRREVLPRL